MRTNVWKCMKIVFRDSFARSTRRILREGSSSKIKMRISLQRRAFKKMHVSLQQRARKCMKHITDARGSSRHRKITILLQSRASDEHEVTKRLLRNVKNLRSATVLDVRRARSSERIASRRENLRFATVLDIRSDERVGSAGEKPAFRYSFGRPASRKWREGCFGRWKMFFSLSFLFFCFIFLICFLPIFSVFLSFFRVKFWTFLFSGFPLLRIFDFPSFCFAFCSKFLFLFEHVLYSLWDNEEVKQQGIGSVEGGFRPLQKQEPWNINADMV